MLCRGEVYAPHASSLSRCHIGFSARAHEETHQCASHAVLPNLQRVDATLRLQHGRATTTKGGRLMGCTCRPQKCIGWEVCAETLLRVCTPMGQAFSCLQVAKGSSVDCAIKEEKCGSQVLRLQNGMQSAMRRKCHEQLYLCSRKQMSSLDILRAAVSPQ